MTRDDILRMAREAGLTYTPQAGWVVGSVQRLEAFAALIAAHEREACAAICDDRELPSLYGVRECAAAIRARGNP